MIKLELIQRSSDNIVLLDVDTLKAHDYIAIRLITGAHIVIKDKYNDMILCMNGFRKATMPYIIPESILDRKLWAAFKDINTLIPYIIDSEKIVMYKRSRNFNVSYDTNMHKDTIEAKNIREHSNELIQGSGSQGAITNTAQAIIEEPKRYSLWLSGKGTTLLTLAEIEAMDHKEELLVFKLSEITELREKLPQLRFIHIK